MYPPSGTLRYMILVSYIMMISESEVYDFKLISYDIDVTVYDIIRL
jgi:hypothetical protein